MDWKGGLGERSFVLVRGGVITGCYSLQRHSWILRTVDRIEQYCLLADHSDARYTKA